MRQLTFVEPGRFEWREVRAPARVAGRWLTLMMARRPALPWRRSTSAC